MVEYLIDIAYRKGIQTIFTTHSNDALRVLPSKAIWAIENGVARQGKLDVNMLRSISGNVDSELAVFVEDVFAKYWIEAVIRAHHPARGDSVGVYNIGGDSKALSTHIAHSINPAASLPSICYLDGDASVEANASKKVYKLPGQSPETYIYDKVKDEIREFKARLAIAMHLSSADQDRVEIAVEEVRRTNRDHHLLFRQLGDKLGYLSGNVVSGAFISTWIEIYPEEAKVIYLPIKETLQKFD